MKITALWQSIARFAPLVGGPYGAPAEDDAAATEARGSRVREAMARNDSRNPFQIFAEWQEEADGCGLRLPTAVALATVGPGGRPSCRMVLCRGADERGFVFYTNLESRKAEELRQNPQAALCFYWMPLGKAVRIEGAVEPVEDAQADAYFASRDRAARPRAR